jgi:hypothetical protein
VLIPSAHIAMGLNHSLPPQALWGRARADDGVAATSSAVCAGARRRSQFGAE